MRPSADAYFACSAFFRKRTFVFGEWFEGHTPIRWIERIRVREMLEYARKVTEAGGLFYLDGWKYRYSVNPNIGPQILMDGYVEAAELARKHAAAPLGASGVLGGQSEKLYVLVTRKVSLIDETKGGVNGGKYGGGKVSLTGTTGA